MIIFPEHLRALTPAQWAVLELPVGLAPLLPAALEEEQMHLEDSVCNMTLYS